VRLSDIYDEEEEQGLLARILFPRYLRMLEAIHELLQSVFPFLSAEEFRLDDPATRKQLALAAEQVVRIDQSTRDQLREVLREGQQRGYSDYEVANGVPADGFGGIKGLYMETWRSRPETIARTETATASLAAAKDRYKATGLVSRVQIVENEDTDEACASMNGKVFPVDQAPGLEHPNCRRGYIPLLDEAA
jgi:SPP1 gp7 family putative phage head morphogenesis protein